MSKSSDSPVEPDEFHDPLENYDPPVYAGGIDQALAEEPVASIQANPFASVPAETSIHEAVERLAALHVACLLVEENGKLVGVFTDRDVLDKVALEADEIRDKKVSEVMTTDPVFVYDTESSGAVLNVMAVSGFRHVPVLKRDGTIVGIASPQRITRFLKQHFRNEQSM